MLSVLSKMAARNCIFVKCFFEKTQKSAPLQLNFECSGVFWLNLVTLVEERLRRLEYLEWKYNEGKMDVPMRIAYGYAIFDEQYDKNMEETRNRADVKMYEKKRAIKAEERK